MDAYGNLTQLSEFSNNRRIRLISYMDPDIAMGVHATLNPPPVIESPIPFVRPKFLTQFGVQRLSLGDPESSVFVAAMMPDTPELFSLGWAGDLDCVLEWGGGTLGIRDNYAPFMVMSDGGQTCQFTVDFVDGCWFALNLPDRSQVVDIYEDRTEDRTPIILYPWHGGANQIWRAEAV